DSEPLTTAPPGRWTTANTPMHISPNADVAGSSFFLAVALNLTVEYQDGSSYRVGGWEPDARTTFYDIRTDVAPFGAVALVAGGVGSALMVVPWRRGRRPALPRVSFLVPARGQRIVKTSQRGSEYERCSGGDA